MRQGSKMKIFCRFQRQFIYQLIEGHVLVHTTQKLISYKKNVSFIFNEYDAGRDRFRAYFNEALQAILQHPRPILA